MTKLTDWPRVLEKLQDKEALEEFRHSSRNPSDFKSGSSDDGRHLHRIAKARSNIDPARRSLVYFLLCGDFLKVGKTQNICDRLKSYRLHNPHPMTLLAYDCWASEQAWHDELAAHRRYGEWYYANDSVRNSIQFLVEGNEDILCSMQIALEPKSEHTLEQEPRFSAVS